MPSPNARLVGALCGLFVLGSLATAQDTRASLSGIVSDKSGSVVPETVLQLTNTGTGVVLSTNSNEAGLYRFLFLEPGRYRLSATIAGFKTWERDNIQLVVAQSATLPVVLEIGAQT